MVSCTEYVNTFVDLSVVPCCLSLSLSFFLCEQARCSLENVVRTRMFVTDVSFAEKVMAEHRKVFSNIRPAATLVVVSCHTVQQFFSHECPPSWTSFVHFVCQM